jgi:hypothetical protein
VLRVMIGLCIRLTGSLVSDAEICMFYSFDVVH